MRSLGIHVFRFGVSDVAVELVRRKYPQEETKQKERSADKKN